MTEIHNRNQSATVVANFDAVQSRLQENPCWGADVLQQAGEYGWRVSTARMYSKGPFGARIIDEGSDCLVAWGISGKKSCLAYRIEREGGDVEHAPVYPQPDSPALRDVLRQ